MQSKEPVSAAIYAEHAPLKVRAAERGGLPLALERLPLHREHRPVRLRLLRRLLLPRHEHVRHHQKHPDISAHH